MSIQSSNDFAKSVLLAFGALDGAFLFWASRHYFMITADKDGFVRHAKKEELRYA